MEEPDSISNKELALAARRAVGRVLNKRNDYSWPRVAICASGFLLRELFPREPVETSWGRLSQAHEISVKAANSSKKFPSMSRERGAEVLLELAESLEQEEQKLPPNPRDIVPLST